MGMGNRQIHIKYRRYSFGSIGAPLLALRAACNRTIELTTHTCILLVALLLRACPAATTAVPSFVFFFTFYRGWGGGRRNGNQYSSSLGKAIIWLIHMQVNPEPAADFLQLQMHVGDTRILIFLQLREPIGRWEPATLHTAALHCRNA